MGGQELPRPEGLRPTDRHSLCTGKGYRRGRRHFLQQTGKVRLSPRCCGIPQPLRFCHNSERKDTVGQFGTMVIYDRGLLRGEKSLSRHTEIPSEKPKPLAQDTQMVLARPAPICRRRTTPARRSQHDIRHPNGRYPKEQCRREIPHTAASRCDDQTPQATLEEHDTFRGTLFLCRRERISPRHKYRTSRHDHIGCRHPAPSLLLSFPPVPHDYHRPVRRRPHSAGRKMQRQPVD